MNKMNLQPARLILDLVQKVFNSWLHFSTDFAHPLNLLVHNFISWGNFKFKFTNRNFVQ